MKVTDGRGLYMKKTEADNRAKIKKWFSDNPGSTQKECREALGLSVSTIRKHVRALMDE